LCCLPGGDNDFSPFLPFPYQLNWGRVIILFASIPSLSLYSVVVAVAGFDVLIFGFDLCAGWLWKWALFHVVKCLLGLIWVISDGNFGRNSDRDFMCLQPFFVWYIIKLGF
jgi:hypothetical protein